MTEVENALSKLAEEINAEHRSFMGTFKKTVEHGVRAGELLARAKGRCPHGAWLPWLTVHFEGSHRTAQEYLRLYKNRNALRANTRDSAHLSVSGALRKLAAPSSDEPPAEAKTITIKRVEGPITSWAHARAFDPPDAEDEFAREPERPKAQDVRRELLDNPAAKHRSDAGIAGDLGVPESVVAEQRKRLEAEGPTLGELVERNPEAAREIAEAGRELRVGLALNKARFAVPKLWQQLRKIDPELVARDVVADAASERASAAVKGRRAWDTAGETAKTARELRSWLDRYIEALEEGSRPGLREVK